MIISESINNLIEEISAKNLNLYDKMRKSK